MSVIVIFLIIVLLALCRLFAKNEMFTGNDEIVITDIQNSINRIKFSVGIIINALYPYVDKNTGALRLLKGDIGPRGPRGPRGMTGDKGDKGDIGPRGPRGPRGMTGDKGDKGDNGIPGPPGPHGMTGPPGPTGQTGPNGASIYNIGDEPQPASAYTTLFN